MKISVKQLKEWGACDPGQLKTFEKAWGKRQVKVTRKGLIRAAELELDVCWWFRKARPDLNDEYRKKLDAIYDEHEKKRAPIDKEYWKKRAPIYEEYRKKLDAIYEEYRKKLAHLAADLLELP